MSKIKRTSKPENHLSNLIDGLLDKKMQLVGAELKQMVVKTSEEYFAKAMQAVLKDSMHGVARSNAGGDLVQDMGLNDKQMLNSLINGLGHHLRRLQP